MIKFQLSFRTKIFITILATLLGLLALFDLLFIQSEQKLLTDYTIREGKTLSMLFADNIRNGVYSEHEALLIRPVEDLFEFETVRHIAIYSSDCRLLMRKDRDSGSALNARYSELKTDEICKEQASLALQPPLHQVLDDSFVFWAPVLLHTSPSAYSLYFDTPLAHKDDHEFIGYICLALSKEDLNTRMDTLFRQNIYFMLVFLVLSIVITAIISRHISSPLARLLEHIKNSNVHLDYNNDMLKMKEGFPVIADHLSMAFDTINDLNKDVEHKAGQLALRNQELEKLNFELNDMNSRLTHDNALRREAEFQVQALTQKLIMAQELERQKIAYELHDNVAQELSSTKIASETLFDGYDDIPVEVKKRRQKMTDLVLHSLRSLRNLSYDLRPSDIEQGDFTRTLRRYCEEFAAQEAIQVNFLSTGLDSIALDYDYKINIFRLLQEALHNIKKHAEANLVEVKILISYPNLIMRIEDNGKGFEIEKRKTEALYEKRMGIKGMEERTRLLGGRITFTSSPESGLKIFVEIPYKRNDYHDEENSDH